MSYPLDPLSAEEFTAVVAILGRDHGVGTGWRIASIELVEPTKAELAEFDEGGARPPRRAEVVCLQRANNATYKGVVSLVDGRVESFDHIPGVQANFTVDEFLECDELVRKHPDFIAALAKCGITRHGHGVRGHLDLRRRGRPAGVPGSSTRLDGHLAQGRSRAEPLCARDQRAALRHRRQLDGIMGEYVTEHIPERIRSASHREPLKPLHLTQPEAVSFTLDGNLLQWQNWSLRIGFTIEKA